MEWTEALGIDIDNNNNDLDFSFIDVKLEVLKKKIISWSEKMKRANLKPEQINWRTQCGTY